MYTSKGEISSSRHCYWLRLFTASLRKGMAEHERVLLRRIRSGFFLCLSLSLSLCIPRPVILGLCLINDMGKIWRQNTAEGKAESLRAFSSPSYFLCVVGTRQWHSFRNIALLYKNQTIALPIHSNDPNRRRILFFWGYFFSLIYSSEKAIKL